MTPKEQAYAQHSIALLNELWVNMENCPCGQPTTTAQTSACRDLVERPCSDDFEDVTKEWLEKNTPKGLQSNLYAGTLMLVSADYDIFIEVLNVRQLTRKQVRMLFEVMK